MAEGFVEQLEIADVEQDDGTTLALAQHVLEVPERGLPIGDVEQGIVIGHVLKLAGMEHTFASLCLRASDAISGSQARPARMP